MTEDRCPYSDLPYAYCGHCKGLLTLEEEQQDIDRGIVRLAERLGRETT